MQKGVVCDSLYFVFEGGAISQGESEKIPG